MKLSAFSSFLVFSVFLAGSSNAATVDRHEGFIGKNEVTIELNEKKPQKQYKNAFYNRNYNEYKQNIQPRLQNLYFLTNSSISKRILAVAEILPDGSLILNPEVRYRIFRANYNQIPKLEKWNLDQVVDNWKDNLKSRTKLGNNTVKLKFEFASTKPDSGKFYLNMLFKDQKLQKYKLSNKQIKHSDWIEVN